MAEAKEYRIKITNELITTEKIEGVSKVDATPEDAKNLKTAKEMTGGQIGSIIAVKMGKDALNFAINSYGDLTGDYMTQSQIQSGLELASYGAMVVAGGVIGLAAATTALTLRAVNAQIELTKRNREVELLRQRVGYSIFSGGR